MLDELRKNIALFSRVFRQAHAAMLLVEPVGGTVREANDEALRWFGMDAGELAGRPLAELCALGEDESRGLLDEALRGKHAHRLCGQSTRDGGRREVDVQAVAVGDGDDALVLLTLVDLTERHRSSSARAVEKQVALRTGELERANEQLDQARTNLRAMLDGSYDAVFMHAEDGTILDVNEKMLDMYQVRRDEIQRYSLVDFSSASNPLDTVPGTLAKVLGGEPQFFEWKARRPHDGHEFDVEVYLRSITTVDGTAILANVRDITDAKARRRELTTLSRAVEQSPASVIITDPAGNIEYVNPKFEQITGFGADEVMGQNPRVLKSGQQGGAFYKNLWETISSGREWRGEFCNRTKNGREIWESASISPIVDEAGNIVQYVAVKEDITELRAQRERIRHLALHDPLTGLPNRQLFMDRLSQVLARRRRRKGYHAAILFVDLDRFKPVNDTFGHAVGDAVLVEVARRLSATVREMDTVARLGGDEFVVIMQEAEELEHVLGLCKRIVQVIRQPLDDCGAAGCDLGASIGVSLCPDHGNDVDTLIRRADQAMYHAKHSGRGTCVLFRPEMDDSSEMGKP